MRVILPVFLSLLFLPAFSQINSIADGAWEDTDTWDCGCVPSLQPITVSHEVTINDDISQSEVIIGSGGLVTINTGTVVTLEDNFVSAAILIESGGQLTNNGTLDLSPIIINGVQADGLLENSGTIITFEPSYVTFTSGSIYQHTHATGGDIPIATWDSNSNCEITGLSGGSAVVPNNLDQSFGNFIWNTPSLGVNLSLGGQLTDIRGDLHFVSSGGPGRQIRLANGGAGYTLSIDGNLVVEGGIFFLTGTLSTDTQVIVEGNYVQSEGTLAMSSLNSSAVTFRLNGNLSKTDGNFVAGSGSGNKYFIFGGNSEQMFNADALPANTLLHFSVLNGSILNLGTNRLVTSQTTGSFTLETGATLEVGSLNGTGAIADQILIVARTFEPGSTIIYNGAGPQSMGVAHPSGTVSTIIENSSGVSLAAPVTIGGNLTLTSGNLSVGGNTLTLSGNVTANGNTINTTSGSSIVINGSGAFGTFPFPAGPQSLAAFTLNRPGGSAIFANDVSLSGDLVLSNGNLVFAGQTLTLAGSITSSGGALSSDDASTLVVNGAGALGVLSFASGGNTLNTLTFNRTSSGTGSIGNTLTITNELNLLQGNLTNTNGLTLGDGVTVTRTSNAQLTGSEILTVIGDMYNVVYTGGGAITTGIEIPATGGENSLRSLTIGAPVTLSKNITVNGDVNLESGSLDAVTFDIRLAGTPGTWTRDAGTFIPGTGTVTIAGDITVVANSTPQAGNVSIISGATLTNPAGVLNLSGHFQINSGATFNNNNGTVVFNGANNQTFSGGGKTFNNITVNKGGGNLQMTSTANLSGLFTIQSGTTVQSNGNLTLLSTSDGATGNASIGPIPSGAAITGAVHIQRYMSEEGNIYRYIAAPVQGISAADLQNFFLITGTFANADPCPSPGCTSSMFRWNEALAGDNTVGYEQFPVSSNSESMLLGRGYAAYVRDNLEPGNVTIDYFGVINSGDISLPVSYTNTGNANSDGVNLVGNPYPSSIYWDNLTRDQISSVIAVRDNGSGGVYQYWDGDGTPNGIAGGVIAAGQAFWVRATGPSPELTISEDAKVSETGVFFRRDQRPGTPNILTFALKKDNIVDKAYYKVKKDATAELDALDGPKLDNAFFDISTLTPGGISMAINSTDKPLCGEPLRLKIKDVQNGNYSISSEVTGLFTGYQVTLVDKYTGSNIELGSGDVYDFTVTSEAGTKAEDRFSVILTEPAIDPGNLIAEAGSQSCEAGNYEITLTGAQEGIYYFAELDGKVLGDSVLSSGNEPLSLSIPSSDLTIGTNEISVKGFNYCTTIAMNDLVTVEYDKVYAVTSNDATDCEGGEVTLEASGAPANGSYNWYEEENSAESISGQHAAVFVTPSLGKSKTYYVAAVNSLGCEGPRVAVKAEVVPFVAVEIMESEPGTFESSYEEGNQWYLDGEVISGATGPILAPTESGTYSVEVDLGGCITTDAVDFLITGVDEFDPDRTMKAYDNPFVDVLRIRIGTNKKVEQMSVFSNLGTKVGDMRLTQDAMATEGIIDMTNAASGMYFVKTILEGRIYTLKVIKK